MTAYAETLSTLRCEDASGFSSAAVAEALRQCLPDEGFAVSHIECIDATELVVYSGDLILSVCHASQDDHDVVIAAESPATGGDTLSETRLLLCAATTRLLCEALEVESVSWHHGGLVYVTDPERNFTPITRGARARQKMRNSAQAALSTLRGMTGAGPLTALIKQHFPSEADIAVGSDYAA